MSSIISKAKTIGKAFIEPLPVDEKWFQDRMKVCDGCEFNSKNIEPENRTAVSRLKITTGLCPEGDHCTACGCCTHRKASQKIEQCGLVDVGQEPKWPALELASKLDSKVLVTNLTPDSGQVLSTQEGILYDLGETSEERINFSIRINRKGVLDIKNATAGCSCTVADTIVIDKNTADFNLSISTTSFTKGREARRTFTIEHYAKPNRIEKIRVTIKVKTK